MNGDGGNTAAADNKNLAHCWILLYKEIYLYSARINSLSTLQAVDVETPLVSSAIELVGKVAVVFLLVPRLAYMGVILSEPIIWCIMVIPLIVQILFGKRFRDLREEARQTA